VVIVKGFYLLLYSIALRTLLTFILRGALVSELSRRANCMHKTASAHVITAIYMQD